MTTADELARRISAKVDQLLAPLDIEIRAMKWPCEYQVIMWEAVGREALKRAARKAVQVNDDDRPNRVTGAAR